MMANYKIYLCLLLCLVAASPSHGRSNEPISRKEELSKDVKIPLYHEIANKKLPRSGKDDHNVEAIRMRSHDDLATARIVGEVLEENVQSPNVGKQVASLESEHLIQVTVATPRKVKNAKTKHQKSKKLETLKNKKKRKQNKQATRKRKYPKKYNGKKHGHKKMKKDKSYTKANQKHEKRTAKKVKSKAAKKSKLAKN